MPSEDTETEMNWASFEAAAKRKLPDWEQTQGTLPSQTEKEETAWVHQLLKSEVTL